MPAWRAGKLEACWCFGPRGGAERGLRRCCPHGVGDRPVVCGAVLVSAEGQFWVTRVVRQLATNVAHCVSLVSAFLSA